MLKYLIIIQNQILPASVTGDVLLNVSPQDVLDVLLLEPALHHQLAVAVNGAHGSQLGEKERQQVLGLTMQPTNATFHFFGFKLCTQRYLRFFKYSLTI